jgi:ATP-binding cassette subfamily C protein LapB
MGALACCTLLSGQVLQPLMKSIAVMQEQESLSVKRADAAELFDLPRTPEPKTAPTGAILQRIEVSGAGYVLPDGAARLAGLDLVIGFGDFIGIRAEDAAMRTPLTRLIRGDLLPSAGSVRFDGLDGSDPESLPLRRQIAYVGPTPAVLRGTILENLTLFRGSAWRDVARRAAALVGVEDDIHLLPDGYDTRIGEGAVDDFPASFLQQIALARAIASGPAVLLLDEVNTPLDRKAEASLIRALDALRGHVTIVLLTLRPSLLAVADRHWLLRDGHLIETPKPTSTPAVSRTGAE